MSTYDWPTYLRPNREIEWRLISASRSGGVATNGSEQITGSPGGVWVGKGSFVLNMQKYGREWRLLSQRLSSRVNAAWLSFDDPLFCGANALSFTSAVDNSGSVAFSDGAFFSDGTGFAGIEGGIAVSAAVTKSTAYIDIVHANDLPATLPGYFISIDNWLYMIDSNVRLTATTHQLKLIPPLRSDITTSSVINTNPKVLVRFSSEDTGRAPITPKIHTIVNVEIQELINRNGIS